MYREGYKERPDGRGWPRVDGAHITIIRDERRYAHAPLDDEGDLAVCGIVGRREDMPVSHAAMWCTTCLTDCARPTE